MQIAQTQAMLANEYGTASNIKSRVNRQSVLAAITSAQQRLKLYTKVRVWVSAPRCVCVCMCVCRGVWLEPAAAAGAQSSGPT